MFFRASNAIISPDLTQDLGLDYHQLGLVGAAFFYSFALVQLPMGMVLDKFGVRPTMVGLTTLGGVGAIVFASAGGFGQAVTGRLILGLGMAANLIGTLKLLTRWFPAGRFATVQGWLLALATLGSLAATSPLALLVQALTWRGAFYLLGGLSLALALAAWLGIKEEPMEHGRPAGLVADRPALGNLQTLLASRDFWLISWATFFRYGTYASIQTLWAGPFLIEHLGLPPVMAGHYLLVMNLGFVVGAPVLGYLADRFIRSRKRTIILALALMAGSMAALGLWSGPARPAFLGLTFALMGFGGGGGNIMYAHVKNLFPAEMAGTALAGINGFTMVGAGVFAQGLGGILTWFASGVDAGPAYRASFLICALSLAVTIGAYCLTKDDAE